MAEQFLYRFLPGDRPALSDGPDAWTDEDRAVSALHFDHLERGADAGIVVMAGRSQDWVGPAIVILEADDEAAARAFMSSDPFLTSGLFRATLHPFRIAIHRD